MCVCETCSVSVVCVCPVCMSLFVFSHDTSSKLFWPVGQCALHVYRIYLGKIRIIMCERSGR